MPVLLDATDIPSWLFTLLFQTRSLRDAFDELDVSAKVRIFLRVFSHLPEGCLTLDFDESNPVPRALCNLFKDALNSELSPSEPKRVSVTRKELVRILRMNSSTAAPPEEAGSAPPAFIEVRVLGNLSPHNRTRAEELLAWVRDNDAGPSSTSQSDVMHALQAKIEALELELEKKDTKLAELQLRVSRLQDLAAQMAAC